jgi:uncharacterized protein DUF1707/FHA domain-containing protein
MQPSSDRLADDNDRVRASDADRDQAIGELQNRFAEGRLSQETFLYRMDAALNARDQAELSELFTDLPGTRPRRRRGQAVRERLSLLRMAVTGRPDSATRHLRAQRQAELPLTAVDLPALCLPRQPDRRFTIGRAMACDFTLADLSVSRWHARLYIQDEQWLLSDLGSTNGTRLNGWRVTTGVPVKPGDQVSFGSVSFVITDRPLGAD